MNVKENMRSKHSNKFNAKHQKLHKTSKICPLLYFYCCAFLFLPWNCADAERPCPGAESGLPISSTISYATCAAPIEVCLRLPCTECCCVSLIAAALVPSYLHAVPPLLLFVAYKDPAEAHFQLPPLFAFNTLK